MLARIVLQLAYRVEVHGLEHLAAAGERVVIVPNHISYLDGPLIAAFLPGYPMFATHDPRLLKIAGTLVQRAGREQGSYEFQMLYGIRPHEQRRLAQWGETVRIYVPYGDEWYGYLMRRLAERPANVAFFLRAVLTKG